MTPTAALKHRCIWQILEASGMLSDGVIVSKSGYTTLRGQGAISHGFNGRTDCREVSDAAVSRVLTGRTARQGLLRRQSQSCVRRAAAAGPAQDEERKSRSQNGPCGVTRRRTRGVLHRSARASDSPAWFEAGHAVLCRTPAIAFQASKV